MKNNCVILVFICLLFGQALSQQSPRMRRRPIDSDLSSNNTSDNIPSNFTSEQSSNYTSYSTLDSNNTLFLFIDHQTGLFNGVRTQTPSDFMNNIIALAKTAVLFNIPTLFTSSAETGPNGPILPELIRTLPDAKIIRRPGEINAFDNEEYRNAVRSYGKKKLVMAGISTDVCLVFAALSALKEGYEVYAVIDASGTWSKLIEDTAIIRMTVANVNIMSWFAISGELQKDWRRPTGAGLAELYSSFLPFYGNLIASRNATISSSANATNH